jgi:chitin-binding protein
MKSQKIALAAALGVPLMFSGVFASQAQAHGTPSFPASRAFICRFMDNVENPQTDGCKAAKAVQGSGPVYEFNSQIINGSVNSFAMVPDGQICNTGLQMFRGFNLAPKQAKYTQTPIDGGETEFRYFGTAPHITEFFEVYVSKPSYTGDRPLMKDDLMLVERVTDSVLAGDTFRFGVNLPDRAAGSEAVVTIVWVRATGQSPEAYITCSDVVYK